MVRSERRIHSLSRLHIGGSAYFVWALPPILGGEWPTIWVQWDGDREEAYCDRRRIGIRTATARQARQEQRYGTV